MAKTQLECYTIYLNKKGKPTELEDITSFGIGGHDLLEVLRNKIKTDDGQNIDDTESKKYLEIRKDTIIDIPRGNYGTFTFGSYGTGGQIKNKETGDLKYTKTKEDTETKPFYFYWLIPDHKRQKKKGFLIIQRYGIEGLKTTLSKYLKKTIRDVNESVVLNIDPVMPKKVFEHLIDNGTIKELVFKEYSFPDNIARRLQIPDHNVKNLYVEVRFKAKKRSGMAIGETLRKIFNSKGGRLYSLKELNSLGFDDLSQREVVVNLKGKNRTVKLNDLGSLTPYLDIDEDVEKDNDNFPILSSIHSIAEDYLNDLLEESYK